MFERTALRRPADITQLGALDLGALAESLIFYTRTSLILDAGSIEDLLRAIGAENLNRLARSDAVDIVYMADMTTIPNAGAIPALGWGVSSVQIPGWQADQRIPELFVDVIGRRGAAKRASEKFLDQTTVLSPAELWPAGINELIAHDVTGEAVRELLAHVAPGYDVPPELRFGVSFGQGSDYGFTVETNLDLDAVTRAHQAAFDTTNEVTIGHLLLTFATLYEDVGAAIRFGSDLDMTPLRSELLRRRAHVEDSREQTESGRLQELVFGDSRAIAEAVQSGRVPFGDVLDLAEHAQQFRGWLAEREPDADLVRDFFQDATHGSWVDRLPTATARWLLVTGSGSAAGLAFAPPLGALIGQRWAPRISLLSTCDTDGRRASSCSGGPERRWDKCVNRRAPHTNP